MKQNMSLGMNQPKTIHKGVPKYSDKYKDVLERAVKREQIFKPKPKQLFFYRVRSIGVGAFSFVYLVAEEGSGSIFAQKSISKKSIAPELFTQIKMHLTLSHPNIVNLYHIYAEQGYVQLIMDYAGQSLFALRKNNKLQTVDHQQLSVSILKQLISAVKYLHTRGIVHADIKLENILYFQGVIKLCDFGYAHLYNFKSSDNQAKKYEFCPHSTQEQTEKTNISKDIVGTFEYLDPQYVQGHCSEFSRDIWAIGIVAYELVLGKNPFEGMAQNEKWSKMLKIKQIETENQKMSPQMHRLLSLTLCPLDTRATISELENLQIFSRPNYGDKQILGFNEIHFLQ